MKNRSKELDEQITTSMIFDKLILESEGLDPSIWEKYIYKYGIKEIKDKGDYILRVRDNKAGVYFVKKGKVQSNLLGRDGCIKTIMMTCEGSLFGEQFIFHDYPGLIEGLIVEPSELYYLNKETILKIMENDFDITLYILKTISIKSRMLAIQIEDVSLRNISQSICRLLYTFCCYDEQNGNVDGEVNIALSHQEIADMLASHRVTVTRNLNNLKNKKILDYKYEKIIIKDRDKLKEIAFD